MKRKLLFVFLFLFLLVVNITCKKDKPTSTHTCPQGQHWDEAQQKCVTDSVPNIDTPAINNNVIIIDSTKWLLNNDTALLSQGLYEYTYSNSIPAIKANDVILGSTLGGYIRRVTSVTTQPGKITLQTTQGNMSDVFKQAQLSFDISSDGLSRIGVPVITKKALTGEPVNNLTSTFSNIPVYQNGPLSITLKNANVELDGDWNFALNFKNSSLDTFEMSCKNAVFNAQSEWNVSATQAITLSETESTIKTVSKYFTTIVTIGGIPVPVIVKMKVDLVCDFSAAINTQVQTDLTVNTSNSLNVGLEYKNAQWQTIYNKTSNSTVTTSAPNGKVGSTINLSIIPKISFIFYGVAGPYSSIGLKELVKADVASPALDWDFYAGAWLQTILGAKAQIFGTTIADYNQEWNTDTFYYQTPNRIQKISGDNQTGSSGTFLSQPVKVQVIDNNDNAQSNVPVYFQVTAGSGSVEDSSILTDKNGYAQTRWKLGSENITQTVAASAKKADGTLIIGAPVEFAATVTQKLPTLTTTSISSVTHTTAISGGNITNEGETPITARGVCWSALPNPTINDSKTYDGTGSGSFTSNITGLITDTIYHVRAYATNSAGTAYGNDVSFSTSVIDTGSCFFIFKWGLPPGKNLHNSQCDCTGPGFYSDSTIYQIFTPCSGAAYDLQVGEDIHMFPGQSETLSMLWIYSTDCNAGLYNDSTITKTFICK